ncbi:protein-export chaperone SecB [Oleiphilus sp. HI0009]|uniref:protein-export chaperone SecB n=2 Tax=Oleiphilus TaxID=141450 RepID=UPI0007C2B550|nr:MULTISPECIES: protein-export chaperone SecB [unclassified Oleiphilus]KZX82224.1 protein-export chaperone SecB [Oleiphilus sp. HI0009]MCH2158421.1 protein-export chaperone SecB [Oleiphilaceae bacterium]KZY62088.1 protein-export chaperone SecB [Oleiphilus sp. HI0066]KZY67883.1 protein-export chaperone SecB [Oleiphilus sp. HI0066]KZY70738.1 protein-export chaperone SecB [Oleiphilus sp. HI0067]
MSENETPVENAEQEANQQPQAGFAMEKVYVKDASFESPNSPIVFTKAWQPKVKMDLNTKHTVIESEVHEVAVTITLTVSVEDMTAYIVEVQQAGIFRIVGLEGVQYHHAVGAVCPNLLFPYLRESIDNIVVKGGFQPVMLAPINFDAMFAQAMAKKQQQEQEAASAEAAESTVQ